VPYVPVDEALARRGLGEVTACWPRSRTILRGMRGLLDDDLLSGASEVTILLRPERYVRPVAAHDMPGLLTEIQRLCQVWGGPAQPVVPVEFGQIPAPYARLLPTEQIDFVGGLQHIGVTLPQRVELRPPADYPTIIVLSAEPVERWRTVQVAELAPDDPWRPIYAATLGTLPEEPDPSLLEFIGARKDVRFDEVIPIERLQVVGSLDDLIDRLTDRVHIHPRQLSSMFMAVGLAPDASYIATNEILPQPWAARRAAGPNIIVAIADGSAEDVALLWNMRVAHGDQRVLPIGLPLADITRDSLRELQQPGRATMFGISGGRCYLTSASMDFADVEALATIAPTVVPVRYEELLTFGPAPGRPRSEVALWTDGRARLAPFTDADRDILRGTRGLRRPDLVLDVYVKGHPLPADGMMRGHRFGPRFQAGAAQIPVSELRREGTVEVHWPPSWTCLAAAAQSRRLMVTASDPGRAAASLLRSLGGVGAVHWLQHRPLIDLLYRLAERSGMSWWKQRWAHAHRRLVEAGAEPAMLESLAQSAGRDEPVVAPAGEGRDLPFGDFRKALGNEAAARRWVGWAERRHLLVRGVRVTCPHCGCPSWLPMASLPPPVACVGCGRVIREPYGPRDLKFTYRIGEPLRRVLETDSLGHILALHWLFQLFDERGLVGAYPGVTVTDASGSTVGEADVLLLFTDGSLVPAEVKRNFPGTQGRTIELMDALSDALGAPYDLLAVTRPARDCAALDTVGRRLPNRPRLLLTDDQLHEGFVTWALGADPFAWNPRTAEQDADRERAFARTLAERDPDAARDFVSASLLDRELD